MIYMVYSDLWINFTEEGPGDGGSEATGVIECDVAGRLKRPGTLFLLYTSYI